MKQLVKNQNPQEVFVSNVLFEKYCEKGELLQIIFPTITLHKTTLYLQKILIINQYFQ